MNRIPSVRRWITSSTLLLDSEKERKKRQQMNKKTIKQAERQNIRPVISSRIPLNTSLKQTVSVLSQYLNCSVLRVELLGLVTVAAQSFTVVTVLCYI